MATLFKTTGEVLEVVPANGKTFTLEELQGMVGGWIQSLNISERIAIVFDEEGRFKGLPFNASAFARFGMSLVGNVVMCNDIEFK